MDSSVQHAAALRMEVRRFATLCGTARALPTLVHVGELAGDRITIPADPSYDAGLRSDVLTRALARSIDERTSIWLTRGGPLSVGDMDLAWFAAARTAFGRHGVGDPAVHVVTRYGWFDLSTGAGRTWRRVRPLVPAPVAGLDEARSDDPAER
jgi:hypothetical protein